MRRMILFILIIFTLALPVSAVSLSPADREYLIRAASSSYPDVGFCGRVGSCSVVLRRMDDPRTHDEQFARRQCEPFVVQRDLLLAAFTKQDFHPGMDVWKCHRTAPVLLLHMTEYGQCGIEFFGCFHIIIYVRIADVHKSPTFSRNDKFPIFLYYFHYLLHYILRY